MNLKCIDEYERDYPIKDSNDMSLTIKRTMTPSNEHHIYTVNKHNKLHGLYRIYLHGNIVKEYEYKDGMLNGPCIEWSSYSGYIIKLITYKNGLMHGNYAEYITIDKLENNEKVTYLVATTNCTYYNNIIHGICYRYDIETGRIKNRYYNNGSLIVPSKPKYNNVQIQYANTKSK